MEGFDSLCNNPYDNFLFGYVNLEQVKQTNIFIHVFSILNIHSFFFDYFHYYIFTNMNNKQT